MKTHNATKLLRSLASLLRAVPALTAAGVLFSGGLAQAQPTLSSIYPDGSVQFQWTNKLSFVTGGTAAVTNISVTLSATPMNGTPFIRIYTSAAGLTINGNNVSAPLQSNVLYTATIMATDATGASTSASASFDTIRPTYTWEAEDWDYDGGQYFDNPQLNAYAGKSGVAGTDAQADYTAAVGTAYRPAGPASLGNLGTEANTDVPRTQYIASGQSDYDVGWNDNGNWCNYTRHYPSGKWNVFVRAAGWAAETASGYLFQGGVFGNFLGQFVVPNTATSGNQYQNFTWVPMTDSAGNVIEWDADGTAQALTVQTSGGNYNANFYLLLPVPAPLTQDATIGAVFPDGTYQFQATNFFSFTIYSTLGVQPANIVVQLTATNLFGKGSSSVLQAGSGLSVSGPATALVVTFPLASNTLYKAVLQVTDANNFVVATTVPFDTITPSYTWEAEDYDYGGGQFIDNPQINQYSGLVATVNVDAYNPNGGGAAYRPINTDGDAGGDLGNEVHQDVPRLQYLTSGQDDYDQGWNSANSGLWGNYTRHYPAGKWNIFMRGAGTIASSPTSPNAQLDLGGPSGTPLGRFAVPNTGNYQSYTWAPLVDVAGNLIEWDTDGSKQTLTILVTGGDYNANYYMLMPVDPNYKPLPFVSPVSPDGTQMFSYANVLSFTANSVPGISSSNVVVTLNGIKPSGVTIGGSPHALTFTCPLATNTVYNAVIRLTDANGSSTYSMTLGTFPASSYTFECEDWDHDSGQFFDNPQLNKYAGLSGVDGVDGHNGSGGNTDYRSSTGGFGNEVTGDPKRAQYVSASANDYDIGWTGSGNWANYTRTYPAGVYNVILRASSPNAGGQTDAARLLQVTSGVGTSTQTTSPLGTFNVPPTGGYENFTWTPLVDAHGIPVKVSLSGSRSTFMLYEDNGGWNANFFTLVPADTAKPALSQVYPDGSAMFQRTNTFSFVASSSVGIDASSVVVTLNGVVVPNPVIGGSATNMTVSCPLQLDTAYTAVVTLNSLNNDPASLSFSFDTFSSQYYTFEAEDWDYNGGQFVDNPQLDAYAGLSGIANVDAYNSQGGSTAYRTNDFGNLGNEVNGDVVRAQYASAATNDYDIGWTAKGNWANYTRKYPAGTYNVYLRGSSPNGVNAGAALSWVTGGLGTTNQATSALGVFNVPLTGGYQVYGWAPLVDANGRLVTATTTGAASTLRLSQQAGGWNANFLMLVPATVSPKLSVSRSGSNVAISWTPVVGQLYQSPAIAGPNVKWQAIAGAANGSVSVPATQGAQFFRVGSP